MPYPAVPTPRLDRAGPVTAASLPDAAPAADPFRERRTRRHVACKQILGGRFRFESDSAELLRLVESAYGSLPPQSLPGMSPDFLVELSLVTCGHHRRATEPPPVRTHGGAGLLCGTIDASNYLVVSPQQRRALVVVSQDMLDWPYHVRYELIEFAVYLLAARGLGLVPLHGACAGRRGRGVLLLGASGAGKSTLALHALLHGLELLAEDAVFVQPSSLLATGVANYLHLRGDILPLVDEDTRAWIASSPIIHRRSGVAKFELDLRRGRGRPADAPMELAAAVFVTSDQARDGEALLAPVPTHKIAGRMAADQPYATGQYGWELFLRRLASQGVYTLRRGRDPQASVDALQRLFDGCLP